MNYDELNALVTSVKEAQGIQAKADISMISKALRLAHPSPYPNGDDASAIENAAGGYDLFAGEGFIPEFVLADPWFAGWCGVMVNVSDIAAMGGRPVAVLDTLWAQATSPEQETRINELMRGMADASQALAVPIIGGHTNLNAKSDEIHFGVSILGRAERILSSFAAKADEHLVMAVDLRGQYHLPYLNWNAATKAPPERLRGDLDLLPEIAEAGLATSAKDISQAGLLGTCLMLLESASLGLDLDLDAVPKPDAVSWLDWCQSFPSFGYLLSVPEDHVDEVTERFKRRDISAASLGRLNKSKRFYVRSEANRVAFWDLNEHALMGFESSSANEITGD